MSKQLPSNANLKHLKGQAKQLLDAHKAGDENACTRFKTHIPRLAQASKTQVRGAKLTLRDAYLVLAREYGYTSWPKLKHHLEAHAIIKTPDSTHKELLLRINTLLAEHTEDAAKTLRRLLTENPKSVAIIAISLGQETTAALLKHLADHDIEAIAQNISNLNAVTTEEEDHHLKHFEQMLMASKYVSQGGIDYARGALEKAVGKRKTQAILNRIQAQHTTVLNRLVKLITERPEDIAHILTHENVKTATLFATTIDKTQMDLITKHLPKTLTQKITKTQKNTNAISTSDKTETLEHIERLAVAFKYVLTGGKQFALGALSKSFGLNKTQKLLTQITPISGFLQLNNLSPQKASTLLTTEPPKTIANILSHLDSPQSLLIFNHLSAKQKKQVIPHLNASQPSLTEVRKMDHLLIQKITKLS